MYNIKPFEEGNAQVINEVCLPIAPLILLRYETIADFYSEEPRHINLKRYENGDSCLFEQVFRLRVWVPNQIAYSWIIYSNSREWLDDNGSTEGLILRNVVWERSKDIERVKKTHKINKGELLNNWPQIKSKNIYLNPQLSVQLIETLADGDKILSKGIRLTKRVLEMERPEWRDLEIRRLFDWGSVQALWSPSMENKDLERYCFTLNEHLKTYINNNLESVYQMDLDFVYPPENYKDIISGRVMNPKTCTNS